MNFIIGTNTVKLSLNAFNGDKDGAEDWDFHCQNVFGTAGLDDALEGNKVEDELQKCLDEGLDKKLFHFFCTKMEGDAINAMKEAQGRTLKAAYAAFKKRYDPQRTMNKLQTIRNLFVTKMDDDGDVDKHVGFMTKTKDKMMSMKVTMDEILAVAVLISLPKKRYGDLATQAIMLENLDIGKLKVLKMLK